MSHIKFHICCSEIFKLNKFRLTYLYECLDCKYVCSPCVCLLVPLRPEEGTESPGPGVTDGVSCLLVLGVKLTPLLMQH